MTDKTQNTFPEDFLWGAATSAYQIEGHPLADGAGASIWHRFTHLPGKIHNEDTGDIACDHYKRYADDVQLMHSLELNAYRFSIAWGRILPDGRGRVNKKGLSFYDRLIDTLLKKNIQPSVTLYHWDLPLALDYKGGWLNRDIANWFADYAEKVFNAFDDRVSHWSTLNEPWVTMDCGYLHGTHAPGHQSLSEAVMAAHNLLLAHTRAVQAYRACGNHEIGIAINLAPKHSATDNEQDIEATNRDDAYMNRYFLDPIFRGAYPDELASMFADAWPEFDPEDLDEIQQPIDFLGINYYTRNVVRNRSSADPIRLEHVEQKHQPHTDIGWEVYPQGLEEILCWVHQRYGDIPLYVTENGAAYNELNTVEEDVLVDDSARRDYLQTHLLAAHRAMQNGVNLRGYYAWSLLDNFEWAFGYSKRFGLVHVDHSSQQRTVKASAHYYRDVIRSNGTLLFESLD